MNRDMELVKPNQPKTITDNKNPGGARLYIKNSSIYDIAVIEVDDPSIGVAKDRPDGVKLVDKLIKVNDRVTYLIELKGKGFAYSHKQIWDTIDYMRQTEPLTLYVCDKDTVLAYSVSHNGRVPASLNNTLLRKLSKLNKIKRQLYEYITFVRCVPKCSASYVFTPKPGGQMLNAPNCPLIIR